MNKISAFTSFIEEKFWLQPNFDMKLINHSKKVFTIGTENELIPLEEKIFKCITLSAATSIYASHTIESYYIDKIYSNRLDINRIKSIIEIFLKKIEEKIQEGENWDLSNEVTLQRNNYYITFINERLTDLDDNRDEKIAQFRELYFFDRIIDRLNFEIVKRKAKQLFDKGVLSCYVSPSKKEMISLLIKNNGWDHYQSLSTDNLSIEAEKEYYTFCNTLFLERDKAIYAFLKENLEKDIQARMKNPKARLLALSTLAIHEKEIWRKKVITLGRAIAIALIGMIVLGGAYSAARSLRSFLR